MCWFFKRGKKRKGGRKERGHRDRRRSKRTERLTAAIYTQAMRHGQLLLFFCCPSVTQSPSRVRFFETPWTAAHPASLSLTISWSLPKFMSIAPVMPCSHLILWCPLFLYLPAFLHSLPQKCLYGQKRNNEEKKNSSQAHMSRLQSAPGSRPSIR